MDKLLLYFETTIRIESEKNYMNKMKKLVNLLLKYFRRKS